MVLQRLSCREAAIACYEDGLKAVVQRIGVWEDISQARRAPGGESPRGPGGPPRAHLVGGGAG